MASNLADAIDYLIKHCPHVVSIHDLITKIRVEMERDYFLELYYNEIMGKYAYTLVLYGERLIGWDNAPHHPNFSTFPHHFHAQDGTTHPSPLTGDPKTDMVVVVDVINQMIGGEE